ncbi:hypothetical protein DPMN_069066 [Dreissena polymorpha]|uniref:Uncharacterized protein n=1 Tax=Dreissena polymorpha TaxID=45954 RepID=A0A9D3Z3E5_DREPO|nr:hypothetical protein DPMN_069066 [Dreissena polymorpha]
MKQPSGKSPQSVYSPFLNNTLILLHSHSNSLGQFLYTWYEISFGPGADPGQSFLMMSRTFCSFCSAALKTYVGASGEISVSG